MKITKERLNKIIKEEIRSVMDEGFFDFFKKKKEEKPAEPAPSKPRGHMEKEEKVQKLKALTQRLESLKKRGINARTLDKFNQMGKDIRWAWQKGECEYDRRIAPQKFYDIERKKGIDGMNKDDFECLENGLDYLEDAIRDYESEVGDLRAAARAERESEERLAKWSAEQDRKNRGKRQKDVDWDLSRH